MHEPARVPRRLVDVDDARLRLAGGIHRKARPAGDPLIGAGGSEVFAIGESRALERCKHQ